MADTLSTPPAAPEPPTGPASTSSSAPTATLRPGAAAPAAPGKGTARLALLVAAVSLVVALVAVGVAGVALVRSGEDTPDTTAAPGATNSAPASAGADAPAAPATTEAQAQPSPTAVLGVLNPQAVFSPAYKDQELIPQVTSQASAYLDLNEPRVVQQGSDKDDVRLELPYNSTVPVIILLDGVEGAVVPKTMSDPQPEDCADLIRKSPVPQRAETAAQRELMMCVATSPEQARAIGQPQRIVVLKVAALSSNAKVTLQLKAWEVPS
ncbi:hypothetical protein [Catellatospora coxensis]|uniref:Uncharacterized protein n=1 Tax=Catellatospora coxensis TaxID=310354 RepID=A0A8J3KXS9_9ACTN|nr:hypothetical protein [Catellatospora coxensis]GIG08083.1 hypothetical protein Cco03nite_47830 [Catellatospora coxensis]